MTFQVPESKRSIKQNRFEFEVDGKKYEIPHLKFAPVSAIEKFEQEQNMAGLLLTADNDEAREAIRSFDGSQLEPFIEAWSEASGVDAGE